MSKDSLMELADRLEATIHKINGHWWNYRKRPHADDIAAAVRALRARTQGTSNEQA
jgi:hypothetical protein